MPLFRPLDHVAIVSAGLLLAACTTVGPAATPTDLATATPAATSLAATPTSSPPATVPPTPEPTAATSPSPTGLAAQTFDNDTADLVYVGHQGQVLEPAPEDHPARITRIEIEQVDDQVVLCAVLPNMTGDEANWGITLLLGENVQASWRFQGSPPTIQTSAINSERREEIGSATFPGDANRPCVSLPYEEAAGADRLGAASSVLPETYANPEEGNQPGHRAQDRMLVGIEPICGGLCE